MVISLPDGDFIKQLENIGCKFIYTPVDRRGINPIRDLKLFFKYCKSLEMKIQTWLLHTQLNRMFMEDLRVGY